MQLITSQTVKDKTKIRSVYYDAVTIFIVLLFIYTGVDKLLNYDRFTFQMALVPSPLIQSFAPVIGWLLPLVELLIVALLVIEKTRRIALWSSLILMAVFEGYIGWMKSTGLDLPCTCGGIISKMSWNTHFVFNAIIILLLIISLITTKNTGNK